MDANPGTWNRLVPPPLPPAWNKVTETIIGCAMEVHSILGAGLLEHLYEDAMVYECSHAGLQVQRQVPIVITYKEIQLKGQRLDLVVNDLVVVELKAVEAVHDSSLAQLVSYLKAGNLPLGLLFNFNTAHLKDGIYRRINPEGVVARVGLPRTNIQPSPPPLSSSGSL